MRLRQNRHPNVIASRPTDTVRQIRVDVSVILEFAIVLGIAEGHLSLQPSQLQRDFLRNRKVVTLNDAVDGLGIEEVDFDGVLTELSSSAEESSFEDEAVLAAAKGSAATSTQG